MCIRDRHRTGRPTRGRCRASRRPGRAAAPRRSPRPPRDVSALPRPAPRHRRPSGLHHGAQAAALIDVDAHVALGESGSEDDPAYSETVRILCAVRDANPGVRYMTTVARRGAGQMVVCDAEQDEEERSHLGEAVGTDVELPRVLAGETPDICLASADQYG